MTVIIILLVAYSIVTTLYAIQMRRERDDLCRANEIRAQMIEETRQGRPPFLLDPGVGIIMDTGRD